MQTFLSYHYIISLMLQKRNTLELMSHGLADCIELKLPPEQSFVSLTGKKNSKEFSC